MPVELSPIVARRELPPDGAVITVASTGHRGLLPFQFYMLSVPGDAAFPLLPRPFSVYDAGERSLDFLIKAVGPGSTALARLAPGEDVLLTGPLGNGVRDFPSGARHLGVAGGVGVAPFLLFYHRWVQQGWPEGDGERPVLIYGARSRDLLYDLDRFQELPLTLVIVTEDGSLGRRGRVTDLLPEFLGKGAWEVLCCGPDPMMGAVARLSATGGCRCFLSLEVYMACGYGVCNACAVKVKDARYREGFRFDRCCVDGPVFDAGAIALP